jgi:hypothetical protein
MKQRTDFRKLQGSEYFDMDKKILSICRIATYNRTHFEKTIVALFL